MCTVSIVPVAGAVRLVCNRDERVTRPAALPPEIRAAGAGLGVWPLDPLSGGTWIGASDAGLVACILNRASDRAPRRRSWVRSRGTIIPDLLQARGMSEALAVAATIHPTSFEPFTLLLVCQGMVARFTNTSERIVGRVNSLARPALFTSSSLGDHLVVGRRRRLFRRMVVRTANPLDGQAAFHDHCWPDHPEISVRMRREGVATVSRTIVDIDAASIRIRYRPIHQ
jgi:hypothetical protein